MSGRAIDHIVLAVRDLDRASATYEGLGFTLTPRAFHEDHMGTSNRLAQFSGRNFIEILEVDRPDRLQPHDFSASPPFFSFGDHNRLAVAGGEGLSMLVFASDDARADIDRFQAAGIDTYAPFDFERRAKLPDGSEATVAFSLGFATAPALPGIAFFVCQNRSPEYFWKPAFQSHGNGATGIAAVYLASDRLERDADFLARMFGGEISAVEYGKAVACGPDQEVRILPPAAIAALDPSYDPGRYDQPRFAGLALSGDTNRPSIPSTAAHGIFIAWEERPG